MTVAVQVRAAETRQQERNVAVFAAVLAVAAYLSFSGALFNDPDTSWHLAAGEFILRTGSVPHVDPFSFTFLGKPWTAHEWLAELVMAAAFRLGSWSGLALLTAAAVSGLMLIVGLELRRRVSPQRAIALLAILFIILAPGILARPHVLAWPLLGGWVLLLMRAREAGSAPSHWAASPMLIWANLHGSFVLGLLIAGAFGLEALIESEDRKRAFVGWAKFGMACLAFSLLTPHGVEGLLFPLDVSSMKSLPLIAEWRPTSLAKDKLFLTAVAATLMLLFYFRPRISPVRLVMLGALLYLALAHARHQPVLAIVATLLLTHALAPARAPQGSGPRISSSSLISACIGFALVGAVRIAVPLDRPDGSSYPISAISSIPSGLRSAPVFNGYNFGGPLILHGIKPFIDGRADMYGDDFMFEHEAIIRGNEAAFARAVSRWGIRWTIVAPEDGLAKLLDEKGWRRIHSDEWAVVHVAP